MVNDSRAVVEAERAAHLDGGCWGGGEEVGGPVEEAVEVADEGHKVAEDGVRVGAGGADGEGRRRRGGGASMA